jgi:NTP pyrophosphatase (non-canonical NTP hydrolase)
MTAEFQKLLADIARIVANDLARQAREAQAAQDVAEDVQQEAQELADAVAQALQDGAL